MNCKTATEELELFVLDALDEPARQRLEAHLACCETCRRAEGELRAAVRAVLDAAPAPAAPSRAFSHAVLTAGRAEVASQRWSARRRAAVIPAMGALAAGLVIAAGIHLSSLFMRSGVEARRTVAVAQAAPSERWRHPGAISVATSVGDEVVTQGGRVFFLRNDGDHTRVSALDATSGADQWSSDAESVGYIAVDSRRVYCLTVNDDGRPELTALDADSGETLWAQSGRESGHGPAGGARVAAVPLGDRVCWTDSDVVAMFDAATGDVLWRREISGEGELSAAGMGCNGLFVAGASSLYCLDPATGEERWREGFETRAPRLRRTLLSVARDDSAVFVARPAAEGAHELICMDGGSRAVLWTRRVAPVQKLLATASAVYLRGGVVQAMNRRTGRPIWSRRAEGCGPVTEDGGRVYFVDSGPKPRLIALNASDGAEAWRLDGLRSCNAFVKRGDVGYIKTQDGVIHALAMCGP